MSEPTPGMMVTSNVRLLRPLGEGGMGAVWLAEHQSLRTQVVVKFMADDLVASPEAKARFSREAAAASQVKSPHVVQMLDHGVLADGAPYIVMELLEGRDLEEQLRAAGRLQPREVVAVIAQLARALGRAHERGVVHRDIKPSNVFLCEAGDGELFVKLLDFGIAKGRDIGVAGSTTRTGAFVGSPYYMSPEQVVGTKDIDFRTDLWSLGVVAYEALTGVKPFQAETVGALALKIHRDPLPMPSDVVPELGPSVDVWFFKACTREPAGRFASAREMADALAVAATGHSLPPGLRVDRTPAPGSRARDPAHEGGATSPTGVDARSETGAGVGLVATDRLPVSSRGKWLVLGAIAVVGLGLAVPRVLAKPEAAPPEPAAAQGTVVAAKPSTTAPTTARVPSSEAPGLPQADPAQAPAASAASSRAGAATVPAQLRPRPAASKAAPSAVAASAAPPPAHPPPSDDDIK